MIKAVLFDMDGTLIDTEKYYRRCWPMALKDFGYEMSDEQALSMRSLGRPFAPRHLKDMFGEEIDYYKVRDRRKQLMNQVIEEEGIQLKPGAIEILEFLKENKIRTGIATANDLQRAEKYLRQIGIREYFDEVICATMVEQGKPAPDTYLFACSQLGIESKYVAAVEDSPNGVLSAYLAGCKVIMVPDQTQPDDELKSKLYACVETLDKIKECI